MSIRYGIALIPEPAFTARAYRARQLICGQYATWAAEMHMLHLTVADFFECPEENVSELQKQLASISKQTRDIVPKFEITNSGVGTFPGISGNIFLNFATGDKSRSLYKLHNDVINGLKTISDITCDARFSGNAYWPHITLMQRGDLPAPVFEAAVHFSGVVVNDLQIPVVTTAWQLTLTRFESDMAGTDWDDGGWAADLRWTVLNSYPL